MSERHRLMMTCAAVLAACTGAKPAAAPTPPAEREEASNSTATASSKPTAPSGMALVPEGTVNRRSSGVRARRVPAFFINRTEVTVSDYATCVVQGACKAPAGSKRGSQLLLLEDCNWDHRSERARHPINCVTYTEALAYCDYRDKRLPTAAEWLRAAAGHEEWRFPWGNETLSNAMDNVSREPGPARHRACWQGDGTAAGERAATSTCPVDAHPQGASPFGVLGLVGNVMEWTSTPAEYMPEQRLVWGGGWRFDWENELLPSLEARLELPQDGSGDDVGFRCAMSASPPRVSDRPRSSQAGR